MQDWWGASVSAAPQITLYVCTGFKAWASQGGVNERPLCPVRLQIRWLPSPPS